MDAQSPHNLPEQPNALLGRDQELKAVREQLLSDEGRLISLIGPPGVGKTRLGIAVAESFLEAFPDGVWFIDLAPLQEPSLMESKIASTFGIAERRDGMMLDSLAGYLRDRQVLLFLDNFEGMLPAAAWIGKLLELTQSLKILTTSREPLHLRWERTILVSPLPLPDLARPPNPSYLEGFACIALFVQRATAVNAAFALSRENAPTILALCHRLDGLPLAIELAAARASVLSPAEILANMDDRFRLLRTGAVDLPERHQTLRAAIDWSYESLSPVEGQFLQRLAIFSGGFSLPAAEIIGESQTLGLDALESLIDLVEKSLVNRARGPEGKTRFTLLESIRDYLLDRLRKSGELDNARRRHAAYYLELAERTYTEMKGVNQRSWLDLLETEHDNLRAAMQWSLDTGEVRLGKRIAAAIWISLWWLRGHIREGVRWLEIFHGSGEVYQDQTDLRVLEGIGMLRGWQGDYQRGRALLMEALQIGYQWEDEEATIRTLAYLGWIFWVNGKTEEAAWLAERMDAFSSDLDPWELAYACLSFGSLLYEAGLDDEAEKAFTRALEYFQFTEEKQQGVIWAGHKLALLRHKKGNFLESKEGMVKALESARQLNDLHVTAYCTDDAAQLAAHGITGQNRADKLDLEKLAWVLGAVDHWREILSLLRTPRETSAYHQIMEMLQRKLGETSYLRAWQQGQAMPVESVIQEVSELLHDIYQPSPWEKRSQEEEGISIRLSERERQVIGLVAEGLSNQEIGARLFITERTVRFHMTSIFNKLGADNRAQAVAIADRLGIL